jgi:MFS family permease
VTAADRPVALGLAANWRQFTLLLVVNAFVGAMVGLERAVMPVMAETEFHVASATATLSFIFAFGLAKASTNLAAGWLADRGARRATLIAGWLLALPIPFIIHFAPGWAWVVAANVLLGLQQGLAWSATVIMKIDLVGPKRRGLAMGLNEFSGYVAVGVTGAVSGLIAASIGPRSAAAAVGIVVAVLGLALSLFVRDTTPHARHEATAHDPDAPRLTTVIRKSLWSDAGLFSASQAGLINNLNDGLVWGLFPLLLVHAGLSLRQTALVTAAYPITWGIGQLVTGAMSDRWGRKRLIVGGMVVQGIALVTAALVTGAWRWTIALVVLGVGTAMVYPTLLAAVGDLAHPSWRGTAVGVYRMWRDLGYVAGALLAGALTDAFNAPAATAAIGVLTAASGVVVAIRLRKSRGTTPRTWAGSAD